MHDKSKLICGDNLEILLTMKKESVDLIYLDPPFFSNRNYKVSCGNQVVGFEDTWRWDQSSVESYQEIVEKGSERVSKVMQAFRTFLGDNDMLAYLSMMAPRLVELRLVLKPTGSIYLHCDSTVYRLLLAS